MNSIDEPFNAQLGRSDSLGATWDGVGVNFALASETAESVDLCLFGEPYGAIETDRISMHRGADGVWSLYILSEHADGVCSGGLAAWNLTITDGATSTNSNRITINESRQLLRFYETGLEGYTYLEEP